ncbi:unnamed protein product [Wuchereria bancrofti]|uniref:Uncharacterized protein n=1 Tax=Wuchereria bancrofti TaxID=6293 RepID=A0A3P7EMN3_WUCBA|nr:unnamed protein product [Wuchereria bancrofti]
MFIDERIAALNSGTPIDDEFEKEIRVNEMKSLKASHLVRENANDVIGLLKDKVHSIALKERLGRLTPKEIRRVSSRKPHPFYDDGTLSFDTQQWMTEDKVVRDGEVNMLAVLAFLQFFSPVSDTSVTQDSSTTALIRINCEVDVFYRLAWWSVLARPK